MAGPGVLDSGGSDPWRMMPSEMEKLSTPDMVWGPRPREVTS